MRVLFDERLHLELDGEMTTGWKPKVDWGDGQLDRILEAEDAHALVRRRSRRWSLVGGADVDALADDLISGEFNYSHAMDRAFDSESMAMAAMTIDAASMTEHFIDVSHDALPFVRDVINRFHDRIHASVRAVADELDGLRETREPKLSADASDEG